MKLVNFTIIFFLYTLKYKTINYRIMHTRVKRFRFM